MKPSITELYETFHRIPELGWMEYQTTQAIKKYMEPLAFTLSPIHLFKSEKPLGLLQTIDTPYQIGETGAIYKLTFQKPGPKVVMRFDIDGLPITETPLHTISSDFPNRMHACGHDHHIALGIRVAYAIHELRDLLSGEICIVFQPAEEGLRGGYHFAKHPWLEGADYAISQHVGILDTTEPTIALSVKNGMGSEKLDITFIGKSSHAALSPKDGRNALLCAAEVVTKVMALQEEHNRINVGTFSSGSGRNIIPDHAKIEMEYRSANNDILTALKVKIEDIIQATCNMYKVDYKCERVGFAPPLRVHEDPSLTGLAKSAGFARVLPCENFLASEDFSHYKGTKKLYFLMSDSGTLPHHHNNFFMPSNIVERGEDFLVRLVKKISSEY